MFTQMLQHCLSWIPSCWHILYEFLLWHSVTSVLTYLCSENSQMSGVQQALNILPLLLQLTGSDSWLDTELKSLAKATQVSVVWALPCTTDWNLFQVQECSPHVWLQCLSPVCLSGIDRVIRALDSVSKCSLMSCSVTIIYNSLGVDIHTTVVKETESDHVKDLTKQPFSPVYFCIVALLVSLLGTSYPRVIRFRKPSPSTRLRPGMYVALNQ